MPRSLDIRKISSPACYQDLPVYFLLMSTLKRVNQMVQRLLKSIRNFSA